MDYDAEYERCKRLGDDIQKARCLINLLYRITELQDYVQLSIPAINPSVALTKELTNSANALLLNASRARFDVRPQIGGYTAEKVERTVKAYNDMVHDYNLAADGGFAKQLKCEWVTERTEPNPDRKKWREYMFKNQEKLGSEGYG